MTPQLRTAGLTKSFTLHLQGGLRIAVLAGVDLAVYSGECVALSGPSGAGKSTLIRCIYGNYAVSGGHIFLRHSGREIDLTAVDARTLIALRRHGIGYVSQFLRVIPRVSSREIVAEPLLARGLPRHEALRHATAWLRRLNLPERLHDLPPATFSGGEQQRVNLARGFAPGFPVLLLDEPTASLDPANRGIVIDLIREAKAAGTAIIGIFHDHEVRNAVADRIFELHPLEAVA